jgi:hypothetical protein
VFFPAVNFFQFLVINTLDPVRIGIQPKMLNPDPDQMNADPDQMNADPQPCLKEQALVE